MADTIKIGSLDISAFNVGSSDCKVYLGSTLLYPQSTTQYKVILEYSGTTPTSYVNCNANSILTSGETRSNPSKLSGATIGDCVTELGEKVFYSCSKFSSVAISDNVSVIGTYAFGYTALSGVTLPSSLTTIGANAFYYTKLESINIPNGCTSIGNNAFTSNTGLTAVTVNATTPPTLGTGVFTNTNANLKIYVPCDSVAAYKAATNWSSYASKIEAIPDSCPKVLQWVYFSAGDTIPQGNVYGLKGDSQIVGHMNYDILEIGTDTNNCVTFGRGAPTRTSQLKASQLKTPILRAPQFTAYFYLVSNGTPSYVDSWDDGLRTFIFSDYASNGVEEYYYEDGTKTVPFDCQLYIYA